MDTFISFGKLLFTLLLLHQANGQTDSGCPSRRLKRCKKSLACVSVFDRCPGDPCLWMCADRSCVGISLQCQDGSIACSLSRKRCQDGSCVHFTNRCPEDPCPRDFPFKCDDTCKRSSVVCDGKTHCDSGADEMSCPTSSFKLLGTNSSALHSLFFIIVPLLPAAIILCIFCCVRKYCPKRCGCEPEGQNQIEQQNIRNTSDNGTNSGDLTIDENHPDQQRVGESSLSEYSHSYEMQLHPSGALQSMIDMPPSYHDLPSNVDLAAESPSKRPHILPSNSGSPSLVFLPSYSQAARRPDLYPILQPPFTAQQVQGTDSRRKRNVIYLPQPHDGSNGQAVGKVPKRKIPHRN